MQEQTLAQMSALAFCSYVGISTTEVFGGEDQSIGESLRWTLDALTPLQKQWELVWGPATQRFPLTIFDENMSFLVKHRSEKHRYTLVIRGTNPISLTNWVLEDFIVFHQADWNRRTPGGAKISLGTKLGLEVIKALKPEAGLPGGGMTLREWLTREVQQAQGDVSLSVVGHSLGGALAPAYALWLDESRKGTATRSAWDSEEKTSIDVISLAGPTPGNKVFADRYNQKLGQRTRRIWNYYDVVPHAWVLDQLKGIHRIYEPVLAPNFVLRGLEELAIAAAGRGNYAHLAGEGERRDGDVVPGFDYIWELAYQHTVPYAAIALEGAGAPISLTKGVKRETPRAVPGADPFASMIQSCLAEMGGTPASIGARGTEAATRPDLRNRIQQLMRVPGSLARGLMPARMQERGWED